jgi:hypothetical protein
MIMTMCRSQTILESSQAPPPNNCLRSVHCHYRSLYLIYPLFPLPARNLFTFCHGSKIRFHLLTDFCGFGRSGRPKGSTNAWGCTIVTRTVANEFLHAFKFLQVSTFLTLIGKRIPPSTCNWIRDWRSIRADH